MREIKFRGRYHLLETDEWIWIFGCNDWGEIVDKNDENWRVDESTIGQWTGLKDKNDTDIYEGDVVALFLGRMSFPGVVKFVEKSSAFCARVGKKWIPLNIYDEFEVIGNIFDDEDLKNKYCEIYQK